MACSPRRLYRGRLLGGLAVAAMVLCGCGGGSDGTATTSGTSSGSGGDPANRYPLEVGDRWVFRKTDTSQVITLKLESVIGITQIQGETAFTRRRHDVASGTIEGSDDHYVKTAAGVFSVAAGSSDADLIYGQRRIELLRFPLQTGTHHVPIDSTDIDLGTDLDGDGINERLTAHVDVSVQALETIRVEAGTFPDAARVVTIVEETLTLSRSRTTQRGTVTYTDWYAPGVGLVKNIEQGVYSNVTTTDTLELVDYRVGGRTSTNRSPTQLTLTQPANGTTADHFPSGSPWTGPLVITSTRPFDATTLTDAIRITSATGSVIPGQTTLGSDTQARQLQFVATSRIPAGQYTVTLGDRVLDLLGQSMPATSFALTVSDVKAPDVDYASLDALRNIVLDGPTPVTLPIDFSEPLDARTATSTSVQLHTSGNEPVPLSNITVVDKQLRFTATLKPRTTYSLLINPPLADPAGNTIGSIGATFTTRHTDMVQPTLVASVPAEGSVNVSPELSTITLDFSKPLDPTSVKLNQFTLTGGVNATGRVFDARLTGPARVTLSVLVEEGQPYALFAGGLLDPAGNMVVASTIRFTTTASALTEFYATRAFNTSSPVKAIRIADPDRDGRADLMVIRGPYFTGTPDFLTTPEELLLYAPQVGAPLDTPQQIQIVPPIVKTDEPCIPVAIEVGDVTGDGQADIVVGYENCGIVIIERRATGRWETTGTLMFPNLPRLRLADLNGDGRLDLVMPDAMAFKLNIAYQKATGGFDAVTSMSLPLPADYPARPYYRIAVGDFTGDGRQDVVLVHETSEPSQRLLLVAQRSDGTLATPRYLPAPFSMGSARVEHLLAGDTNGDGRTDLLVYGTTGMGIEPRRLLVHYLQNADGTLTVSSSQPVSDDVRSMEMADWNGDGRPDVLLYGDGWIAHALQASHTGVLRTLRRVELPPQRYEGIADFNGDGKFDLVSTSVYMVMNSFGVTYQKGPIVSGVSGANQAAAQSVSGQPILLRRGLKATTALPSRFRR